MSTPMNISDHDPLDPRQEDASAPRIQELTQDECWELLNAARLARLGTVDPDDAGTAPEEGFVDITPINIVASDGRLYFRSARGTKLTKLQLNPKVTVEIDTLEGDTAQSVILRGEARLLTDSEDLLRVDALPLKPWLHTEKIEYVEIVPVRVTGRRFHLGA